MAISQQETKYTEQVKRVIAVREQLLKESQEYLTEIQSDTKLKNRIKVQIEKETKEEIKKLQEEIYYYYALIKK